MLCMSTIFPITPPELFALAMRIGLTPTCWAVMRCKLPNSTFDDVSDPVSATPSHPNIVPKNGYHTPVRANAKPRIASNPEYRVRNPMASIAAMVNNDSFTVAKARP